MITHERLLQLLEYDPPTGLWIWRVKRSNAIPAGSLAGTIKSDGYVRIRIDNCAYYSSNLVHLYMTGKWPQEIVDHRNGIRHDDRWTNLRPATNSDNAANRKTQSNNLSGFVGVSWDRSTQKWEVRVNRNYLGRFTDLDEAVKVRDEFAAKWQGEFARLNITTGD